MAVIVSNLIAGIFYKNKKKKANAHISSKGGLQFQTGDWQKKKKKKKGVTNGDGLSGGLIMPVEKCKAHFPGLRRGESFSGRPPVLDVMKRNMFIILTTLSLQSGSI